MLGSGVVGSVAGASEDSKVVAANDGKNDGSVVISTGESVGNP
jgi:hypothetical protein